MTCSYFPGHFGACGMTGHVLQPGRVDRRGLTNRRTISVRESEWRALHACMKEFFSEKADEHFYTCMEGSRVSTRQGAFTFEIYFSCSRRSRTAMPMNRRRFTSIRRRRAPKKASWVFRWTYADNTSGGGSGSCFPRRVRAVPQKTHTGASAAVAKTAKVFTPLGHGDFRETHRGGLGGVFRIIS